MSSTSPFSDIVVFELCSGSVGTSFCGLLFRLYGAEVIKLEPTQGDALRNMVSEYERHGTPGALFQYLSFGKESVTVSSVSEIIRAIRRLEGDCTCIVLIDDIYSTIVSEIREHISDAIIVHVSEFGTSGPMAGVPGCEIVGYAASGLMSITGDPDSDPLSSGTFAAEYVAGQTAFVAAIGALQVHDADEFHRSVICEVSGLEANVAIAEMQHMLYEYSGRIDVRKGNRHGNHPWGLYPCQDGWAAIIGGPERRWPEAAKFIDPRLGDERFATPSQRRAPDARDEIDAIVLPWSMERTKLEIFEAGQRHGFAFGYVATMGDILSSIQLASRKFFLETNFERGATVLFPRRPAELMGLEPSPPRTRAPQLGEDNSTLQETPGTDASLVPYRGSCPSRQPLGSVRVLDLTQIWAGPHCTRILADLGAQVIKVESWKRWDPTRGQHHTDVASGNFANGANESELWYEYSAAFNCLNRGKLDICLDLSQQADRESFLKLVEVSDVVCENFSVGVMERFGLTYDILRARNPDLIYLSMTAFGRTGPHASFIGYGVTQEALSGVESVTGYEGGEPMKSGVNHGDPVSGNFAAALVLMALRQRDRGLGGQMIDFSQLEANVMLVGHLLLEHQISGVLPQPMGNKSRYYAPSAALSCQDDGWVVICCRDDEDWRRLCRATGSVLREFVHLDLDGRRQKHDSILKSLATWAKLFPTAEVAKRMRDANVPSSEVLNYAQVVESEHLADRDFFEYIVHPHTGTHRYPAQPWQYGGLRPSTNTRAPLLNEHVDVVANLFASGWPEKA